MAFMPCSRAIFSKPVQLCTGAAHCEETINDSIMLWSDRGQHSPSLQLMPEFQAFRLGSRRAETDAGVVGHQVDGKRIAVRRRMGRRNERDSGPGTDSSLPWAQSSSYGPEQGAAGQYPPPPYPYESADANGLPYPPPLPHGYLAGAYPAAPEPQPAAADEPEEEEER